MPRLNKLIQGSPDWHEYRSNHIMATDAATILDIKCPGADTHNFAINADIKPYYHCQMQHQMMVTRTKLAIYVSLRPECLQNPFVILEVQADEGYQKILYEAEEHFWTQLNTFQKPQHWIFNNEDK